MFTKLKKSTKLCQMLALLIDVLQVLFSWKGTEKKQKIFFKRSEKVILLCEGRCMSYMLVLLSHTILGVYITV